MSPRVPAPPALPAWVAGRWADVAIAGLALVAGYLEWAFLTPVDDTRTLVLPALVAAAAGLARRLPAAALSVVWLLAVLHLVGGHPVAWVEAAVVAWVAFAVGRWGSRAVVTAAVVSVPGVFVVGVGLAVVSRVLPGYYYTDVYPAGIFSDGPLDGRGLAGGSVLVLAGLLLPLLGGLALRSQAEADTSRRSQAVAEEERERAETQAEQATEIARLREEQTRLSRDVHDVVGHSLAVILAQAESAQFLPDDPAQLKATLATIATSARSSLRDVRQVLSPAAATAAAPPAGAMELLVDGVRSGGRTVEVDEVGTPRPLPPELDVVAHRVLQEMLTNAVKHGARDRPVRLERHWPTGGFEHDLRLEVSNVEDQPADGAAGETQPLRAVDASGGTGIDGMRRRLESVGGRLDVRRRTHDGASTFTATAWVPVSGRVDG